MSRMSYQQDASFPEPQEPPCAPEAGPGGGDGTGSGTANIVYILYLVGLFVWLIPVVGVIVAYVNKGEAPAWLASHYRFQIRTFWIGLLFSLIGTGLTLVFVGYLVLLFVLVWWIVRCVKGLKAISRRQAIADPGAWLW
mgnify:CR=1 FL=1